MQSLLMCFYSASDGCTDIEQTPNQQLSCWNPEIGTPASERTVDLLVDPDLVGRGYIARWRSAKRLSGCAFKARCLYRTMSVKWWNWRRILIISKLAREFLESAGSRFGIGAMA